MKNLNGKITVLCKIIYDA